MVYHNFLISRIANGLLELICLKFANQLYYTKFSFIHSFLPPFCYIIINIKGIFGSALIKLAPIYINMEFSRNCFFLFVADLLSVIFKINESV